MALLDAARDRLDGRSRVEFETRVEAVRAGTIFAHNAKAYQRWQRGSKWRGKPQRGLTGAALEQAVMGVARLFPDNVIHGTA